MITSLGLGFVIGAVCFEFGYHFLAKKQCLKIMVYMSGFVFGLIAVSALLVCLGMYY